MMKSLSIFYLLTVALINFHGVLSRLKLIKMQANINFKGFQSVTPNPQPADFPEASYLSSRPNTAVGFTGGGSRAFLSAIGYLSGLTQLGLIKNIRYIGGISGGGWASSAYVYKQNNVDDNVFLGPIINPEDITVEGLKRMDRSCARGFASAKFELRVIAALFLSQGIDQAWTKVVHDVYLKPSGISRGKYFSWNTDSVADIVSRNPKVFSPTQFILPSDKDRPFLIMGMTNNGPTEGEYYTGNTHNFTHLEITPLYVGQFKKQSVKYVYNNGKTHYRTVGGAIEPFAFAISGNEEPPKGLPSDSRVGGFSMPQPSGVFDLSEAASVNSYAVGTEVEAFRLRGIAEREGMKYSYWSTCDAVPECKETYFADGGCSLNIPLMGFLQRRVEKIILFIDGDEPLYPSNMWDVAKDPQFNKQLGDTLSSFFGMYDKTPNWLEKRGYDYSRNQVYSLDDYIRVIQGLQAAQQKGDGIIGTFQLTTIENEWWGIPAGITSEVTIVYLGRLKSWEAALSPTMKKLLVSSDPKAAEDLTIVADSPAFKNFPHYKTIGGDISYEKANALSDLTGWTILKNADLFRSILCPTDTEK